MLIDLSTKILDLNSNVLQEAVNGVLEPVTVGKVFVGALLNSPDQHALSGADKEARFRMAVRVAGQTNTLMEFTQPELALLKDVVGKSFGTLVVGRVYDMLDQTPRPA